MQTRFLSGHRTEEPVICFIYFPCVETFVSPIWNTCSMIMKQVFHNEETKIS